MTPAAKRWSKRTGPAASSARACDHKRGYELRGYDVIECKSCGHQASATAGTLLHAAKLPLSKMVLLLYLLVAEKDGANYCDRYRNICR
ncbi:MAG: hypothetical protein IT462_11850 [Planctomycetes bacterium]|nr:hypothetical protein [Planctomycetota bacterium]